MFVSSFLMKAVLLLASLCVTSLTSSCVDAVIHPHDVGNQQTIMLRGRQKGTVDNSKNNDLLLPAENSSKLHQNNDQSSHGSSISANSRDQQRNRNLNGFVTSSSPVILSNGVVKVGVSPTGRLFANGNKNALPGKLSPGVRRQQHW